MSLKESQMIQATRPPQSILTDSGSTLLREVDPKDVPEGTQVFSMMLTCDKCKGKFGPIMMTQELMESFSGMPEDAARELWVKMTPEYAAHLPCSSRVEEED